MASNLWSWQRAQPIVRPRKTEPTVPVISVNSDWRFDLGNDVPPDELARAAAAKARGDQGIADRRVPRSSPAIWSIKKRS